MGVLFNTSYPFRLSDTTKTKNACGRSNKKKLFAKIILGISLGKSVTHKGVDIFAKRGTNIRPATAGIVLYTGKKPRGGNVVFILGPRWRIHYYAHLDKIKTNTFSIVSFEVFLGRLAQREMLWENLHIFIKP